eukprot:613391-Prymnesium_polylepis.1
MTTDTGIGRERKLLNAPQITELLLRMCTSSTELTAIFLQYATGGRMSLVDWLSFVHSEQLTQTRQSCSSGEAHHSSEESRELAEAQRCYEQAVASRTFELSTDRDFGSLDFAQQLISPQNSAVTPARAWPARTLDAEPMTKRVVLDSDHEPMTDYWTSCSHNVPPPDFEHNRDLSHLLPAYPCVHPAAG